MVGGADDYCVMVLFVNTNENATLENFCLLTCCVGKGSGMSTPRVYLLFARISLCDSRILGNSIIQKQLFNATNGNTVGVPQQHNTCSK